jgi:hypothetical protein
MEVTEVDADPLQRTSGEGRTGGERLPGYDPFSRSGQQKRVIPG